MRTLLLLGLCVPLFFGCGSPSAEDSEQSADDMRDQVQETVRTVVAGLADRGVQVTDATGSYESCGLKQPQLGYRAGIGTTEGSGPIEDQVAAAREVIEGLGLPMKSSDAPNYVSTDAAKDPLRVSANEARAKPGTLVIEVVRGCEDVDQGVHDDRVSRDVETIEQR